MKTTNAPDHDTLRDQEALAAFERLFSAVSGCAMPDCLVCERQRVDAEKVRDALRNREAPLSVPCYDADLVEVRASRRAGSYVLDVLRDGRHVAHMTGVRRPIRLTDATLRPEEEEA